MPAFIKIQLYRMHLQTRCFLLHGWSHCFHFAVWVRIWEDHTGGPRVGGRQDRVNANRITATLILSVSPLPCSGDTLGPQPWGKVSFPPCNSTAPTVPSQTEHWVEGLVSKVEYKHKLNMHSSCFLLIFLQKQVKYCSFC